MLYSYTAADSSGQAASGQLEAGSERELAEKLREKNLFLLEAKSPSTTAKPSAQRLTIGALFHRVSLVERMVFSRNLAVMIGAGLPMVKGLEALEAQTVNPYFAGILRNVREEVLRGKSLAESLRPYERTFGLLFINMVESGEVSGSLESVLKLLARQMRRDHDLRAKVRGALIYPSIVIIALFGVGVVMMTQVVPILTKTFGELGIELPLSTRIIIGVSKALLNYGLVVAAGMVALVAFLWRIAKAPSSRRLIDATLLKLPIFGGLIQKFNSARFARTLASLIAAGMPITRSLEITSRVLGNSQFRETVGRAAVAIQRGEKLGQILSSRPDLFPAVVTQMVAVGEETGTLSKMLLRLALFYEEEVATTAKNLSTIIEPVLMIIIGAAVGFFAISMIQPIYGGLGNF